MKDEIYISVVDVVGSYICVDYRDGLMVAGHVIYHIKKGFNVVISYLGVKDISSDFMRGVVTTLIDKQQSYRNYEWHSVQSYISPEFVKIMQDEEYKCRKRRYDEIFVAGM